MADSRSLHMLTTLTLLGRSPADHNGSVSPPVERTSTRVFDTLPAIEKAHSTGRLSDFLGSSTPDYLEDAVAKMEGEGAGALITGTGMSALSIVFLTVASAGSRILMPDTVFWPTRKMADGLLNRFGVRVDYYDPMIGAGIADIIDDDTCLVLTESPGSNTFEVQDIPAITQAAHAKGVPVAIDNSWATPLCFRPLDFGVDFSISALTKYLVGHSDVIIGSIAASPEWIEKLRNCANQMGDGVSADDASLALRGMRTLGLRLAHHQKAGLEVARWLAEQPNVIQVLHPALETCPGHAFWKRDFSGSTGLFAVLFRRMSRSELEGFLERLKLFKLGYSWGGFESLVLPFGDMPERQVTPWETEGTLIRVNVGLEEVGDLLNDLDNALAPLRDVQPA